jgi:FdrA protein
MGSEGTGLIRRLVVKKSTYRDSISLLRATKEVAALAGVRQAAVVMATPLNLRVLGEIGFVGRELKKVGTDDMVIAIEADDDGSLDRALAKTESLLVSSESVAQGETLPESLSEAMASMPDANLLVLSVPGAYAKHEAMKAMAAGLDVFMFSSNVSRKDERELKEEANRRHLLLMGPDCGTSIINHTVLGFGNAIREGPIGIVSASGTGLQEVATLVHKNGLGISQAIGTGGGDLSDEVGGITTSKAFGLLEGDASTKVIVLISKPPGTETMKSVLRMARSSRKKVVVCFIGASPSRAALGRQLGAATLVRAAELACSLVRGEKTSLEVFQQGYPKLAFAEASRLAPSQKHVRGLFAGGTLCYEAQVVLSPLVGDVYSNSPIDPRLRLGGQAKSKGHTCVDMGAEDFVVGRAHPMIDFTLRKMRILEEAKDPETGVILLDLELGIGSNPDPAGELSPTIRKAKAMAQDASRYLSVVASVVGTDGDFQGLEKQEKTLAAEGVLLAGSNAAASFMAALIASRGRTQLRGGRSS